MNEVNESVNLIQLCDENPKLANDLLTNFTKYPNYSQKNMTGIPAVSYIGHPLNTSCINRIVSLRGSLIRAYQVLFKNVVSQQICLKCNQTNNCTEQECPKSKKLAFCPSCGSTNIRINHNFQKAISSQIIRIQDLSNASAMSETIEILLEGEDAGKFIPGDKVFVTGLVFRKWKQLRPNEPMISTLCVKSISIIKEDGDKANSYELKPLLAAFMKKDIFERRKFLLKSFASEIEGCDNIKLGFLLGILGGGGSSSRSSIHILLFGEPGTGKSHFLKLVTKLISPSILANGVGTSDAGLTSCAMRQGKDWSLEAGALVLADKGVCCIDQFHKLKVNEKSGLLEAMEQQTVSVAKAGMVVSLNTKCSVFASVTISSKYDLHRKLSENLNLSTPLISRFDLIFGLFDARDANIDSNRSEIVLMRGGFEKKKEDEQWGIQELKLYISQTRKRKNKIDKSNSDIILKYYTKKRKHDGHNEFNTIRMLESLIRLSEAHSKLMNEEGVTENDVYSIIILMETCVDGCSSIMIDMRKVFRDEEYFNKIKEKIRLFYELD